MSSSSTSTLTNISTPIPLTSDEVAMTSHPIGISLHVLSAMKLKYATFSCLFLLPCTISLTTFNRRIPLLILIFADAFVSFRVPPTTALMAKISIHAQRRSTGSTMRRSMRRNPTLLNLVKLILQSVISAPIARNICTLISVRNISSQIDSSPSKISLPVLHLHLHPQGTFFVIMRT